MYSRWSEKEDSRIRLQLSLDEERTLLERNRWGQFATPPSLASEIIRYALQWHEGEDIFFLEPSCGSGSFFSALLRDSGEKRLRQAVGVELDPRFAQGASQLWSDCGLQVIEGDFTSPRTVPGYAASLLVANPPYVRHHHISPARKRELAEICAAEVGIKPSGLSGLYSYFVLLSHRLLAPGAVSAWLIPSEFMDVNYGRALKEYLTSKVQLLRVHQYDASETQFDDALVTSTVVLFRNAPPDSGSMADFSFGGSLRRPEVFHRLAVSGLSAADKWSQYANGAPVSRRSGPMLSDFFKIRRGLATGSNAFFIMPREEAEQLGIQRRFLRPVLPSPRKLKVDIIAADGSGWPELPEQLALLDCALPLNQLYGENPALARYLDSADDKIREGYLVSKRSPWYKQERRDAAPILLTYMGRGKGEGNPLRFIRNDSEAVATNVYLMLHPKGALQDYLADDPKRIKLVHEALLTLTAEDMRGGGKGLRRWTPQNGTQRAGCPFGRRDRCSPSEFEYCEPNGR